MSMRKIFLLLSVVILTASACLKDDNDIKHPIDPVEKYILGKWAFKAMIGYEAASMPAGVKPFEDTIIYMSDAHYYFINDKDTTELGEFSIGQGQAINGNGHMQTYDSLIYKPATLTHITSNAPPPTISYFRVTNDTLSIGSLYFKDSTASRLYINYVRQ